MKQNTNTLSRRRLLQSGAVGTGLVAFAGTGVLGTAAAGIGDGRVLHYTLNNMHYNREQGTIVSGHVHDSSSFKNHGTSQGDPEVVKDTPVGNGYEFDGSDDYVLAATAESLDLAEALTISFWFKLTGTSSDNQYPRPVSKGNSTSTNGAYSVYVEDGGGTPTRIGLRMIDSTGTQRDVDSGNTLDNYDDGMWHHVAATYAKSEQVGRLWVDGTMEVETQFGTAFDIRRTDDPVTVGAANGARFLNGMLDEVRIYNRALTDGEVMDLWEMPD